MVYKVKCTHCSPLLMNTKILKDGYFSHDAHDTYIHVTDKELANMIEQLNGYQEGTFKTYQQILEYIENFV